MKALNILFTKGWGGLERYAIEQARAMAARGHGITFICRRGSNTAGALKGETAFKTLEWAPIKYIDLRVILAIRAMVRNEGIGVVHAHNSADLGLTAPALWRIGGVRLIFSNYMQVPEPKRDLYHRLEYGRVDLIITGSGDVRRNTIENLPVQPDKVVTLPYGLDMARFDPDSVPRGAVRGRYGIGADVPLIGVISRLDPLKGQREMIEAMPDILKREPRAMLILTGGETPELEGTWLPKLGARVKELGIADKVIFTGPTDDTASILADLDVYVLPSYSETFSLGCLEAMAMRKPVVGTRSGGTPEMLDNGACGLLAEPKDAASLAENVLILLGNTKLRERLSAAARKKAEKRYDRNITFDKLDAIYRGG